ncbi:MAG: cytochrome C [Deltaproteobacteria bacterium]|nr:cytochrome C [Deltaproteobacteria bacterium]
MFLLLAQRSPAAETVSPDVQFCLTCHSNSALELVLPSGEKRSLFVDVERFGRSVHGDKLRCTDCHSDVTTYPHPARSFKNLREFTLAYYEICKGCHFDNYTKTLDSVHYVILAAGNLKAPLCVDCHGAHDVARPGVPKSRISKTCSRCHQEIYQQYSRSVHGKALLQEGNADAPVCADCHRAHNIEDPRTASFRLRTPELCARCHTDEKLMKKYGLSTMVLQTYLKDFHGMTASSHRKEQITPAAVTAVCTDCHGVHDILSVKDPRSAVMKANLVRVCAKCHAGATENFPAAWLSHYEPSPQKAPLVYYVKLFYQIFIPFVIAGLVLQILLHIWRVVVNR